jgi:hypothetical protein
VSVSNRSSLRWRPTLSGLVLLAALDAAAATPVQTQQFLSASGRTYVAYYDYDGGPCGAGVACDFRGVIHAKPGFEQAEVFLAGFRMETGLQADAVSQVSASAQRFRYDPATGDVEVGVGSTLRTRSGQSFSYHVTFVVILTAHGVAQFTTVSSGCAGVANCHIARTLAGAVPAGMRYIGLATSIWHFGSSSGPIVLNTLSGDVDSLTVSPPSVNLDYLCVLQAQRPKGRMFCEWSAKAIAFDPAEMTPNGSPIFPQYTFLSWNTTARAQWVNQSGQPSHLPIAGFLDAFQGLTLTYQTFPPSVPAQSPVWSIESSAGGFHVDPTFPDVAMTQYGIFFGTTFGNSTSAKAYAYQSSRAFGFLR